jgi:hypothetical protein
MFRLLGDFFANTSCHSMHSTSARIHIYAFNLLLKALDSEILFKKYKIYCTVLASFYRCFSAAFDDFLTNTVQYTTVQYSTVHNVVRHLYNSKRWEIFSKLQTLQCCQIYKELAACTLGSPFSDILLLHTERGETYSYFLFLKKHLSLGKVAAYNLLFVWYYNTWNVCIYSYTSPVKETKMLKRTDRPD